MSMRPDQYYLPPTGEQFAPYINRKVNPPVNPEKLRLDLLYGEERARLETVITGDMSLALSYKEKEAYVASFADQGEALGIVQLQGREGRIGYRTASGLYISRLFASQIHEIISHPESPYKELYMPRIDMIEGVEVVISDLTVSRYEGLAIDLCMKYSAEEPQYIRKLR